MDRRSPRYAVSHPDHSGYQSAEKQGGDVLKHMRLSRRCADALVIVASTSNSVQDREQMKIWARMGISTSRPHTTSL